MDFAAAVEYLLGLGNEILTLKLGLRNTELLLQALDNPQHAYPAVQIAGTNGKGSTAAMLDSICRAAGIRSGLYTSPHLVSITERIRLAGQQITEADFARHTTTVREASERLVAAGQIEAMPTFFEQMTAIGLLAFRDARIEQAILETGMGGRLDSTTAAKADVVAITRIAMDHERYLGETIEQIAAEKAAIIRPGVKAILAKQQPEALSVLLQRCAETGVEPVLADSAPAIVDATQIRIGLRGRHQIENARVAIQLAESLSIPGEAIVAGIETTHHPGRLELISSEPPVLLDGAHNPAGAETLRDYLNEFHHRPLTIIFGAMEDKNLERIGEILFPLADCLILTKIDNLRTAPLDALESIASRFASGPIIKSETATEAFQAALRNTPREGLICVTGSLYLIGEWKQIT